MVLRAADRGKHRRVGRRAVLQQGDLVAQDERAADDRLFQRDLLFQDVDVAGFALELREDGGAFLRRKRTARILESGRLPGVPRDHGIGVGQGRATAAAERQSAAAATSLVARDRTGKSLPLRRWERSPRNCRSCRRRSAPASPALPKTPSNTSCRFPLRAWIKSRSSGGIRGHSVLHRDATLTSHRDPFGGAQNCNGDGRSLLCLDNRRRLMTRIHSGKKYFADRGPCRDAVDGAGNGGRQ